jgi:hypothetical protein
MGIGAFGPWVKALGVNVGGTDGANDGWIVVAVALIGALVVLARRGSKASGIFAIVAGTVGAATTIYDRSNVSSAIDNGGPLAQSAVQVGWGLNLAIVASISLAIAGLASFVSPAESVSSPETTSTAPASTQSPPAGWYQDPNDPTLLRYWAGTAWTTHTARPAG